MCDGGGDGDGDDDGWGFFDIGGGTGGDSFEGGADSESWRPSPPTNSMAIAAAISVWFVPFLGIVFGHRALVQMKKRRESEMVFAIFGLLAGYAFTAFFIGVVLVFGSLITGLVAAPEPSAVSGY